VNKYLVGFGDSWAAGSGLDFSNDQKAYITIAADKLGLKCHNCAIPGTGIPHLVVQLKKFVGQHYRQNEIYHAVFFLSAMERDLYFDETGQVQEIHPQNKKFSSYFQHIYSQDLGTFKLNTMLLSLQQLCCYYGIKDHYIFGWQIPELWPEIDRSKFWQQGQLSLLDLYLSNYPDSPRNIMHLKNMDHPWMIKCQYAGDSNGGHPNQLGHEKISQTVVDWLRPCI
jgi:hypothetical protein